MTNLAPEAFIFRNRSITFERWGDGPPLVFLHGLGADRAQSAALLRALPSIQVIAPDAPSHGESAHAPDLHTFDAIADALVGLLDHLGVRAAVFGGISMGSGVALNAALRHPERVRGLVLVRPAWLDEPNPENLGIIANLGRWIVDAGPDAARGRLRADPFFGALTRTNPASAASIDAVLDRPGIGESAGVLADMVADRPLRSLAALGEIEIPALVLSTEEDPLHPAAMAAAIGDRLPAASVRETPPRYLEPDRHAEAVRGAVEGFLRDHGEMGTG